MIFRESGFLSNHGAIIQNSWLGKTTHAQTFASAGGRLEHGDTSVVANVINLFHELLLNWVRLKWELEHSRSSRHFSKKPGNVKT